MTEISPEAEAAGNAAALAVENAQEQQETREVAFIAADAASTAAVESEIAAQDAEQALVASEAAGNAAAVVGGIAVEASDQAQQAQATATEAKSEIQVLRQELLGKFDEVTALLKPPEKDPSEVKEVTTDGGTSTDDGVSDSGGESSTESGTDSGGSGGKSTKTTPKRGRGNFRRTRS